MSKNNYKLTLEAGKKITKDKKGKEIDELKELIQECESNREEGKPFTWIINKIKDRMEKILANNK